MSQFFESVFGRLATLFDPGELGIAAADTLANLLIGAVTFLVYYLVWRALDHVARLATRRLDIDPTSRDFTLTILKFSVLTLAAVSALAAVGVNTASLLTSLGIAGLTIGFAARDALSNMISGVLIYWDRPFVIGDLVEVGESYGRVERITLRSTRVVTPDGRMLAVPNTEIVNTTVASYTNFPHLRIDIPVTVSVDSDLDRVREILLDLVREDPAYMKSPEPVAVLTQLNDYNVCMELRAWLSEERRHIEARVQLRERAFRALTAAGIDLPFETFRIEPLTVKQAAA
ncbi:MAG TPA: mechanosensitive ion channel family protein [Longimicrobiales bacterium]|nr:mechanosensitive ion channel family protein [Longimicrobiales bacterium]